MTQRGTGGSGSGNDAASPRIEGAPVPRVSTADRLARCEAMVRHIQAELDSMAAGLDAIELTIRIAGAQLRRLEAGLELDK